jgi:hypothetical protein
MSGLMGVKVFCLLLGFSFCPAALAQDGRRALPDHGLTPGDAAEVTAADICKVEYENPDSNVPTVLKHRVYSRYRVSRYEVGYNVDHLVPVKLGGTNSIENLWPQPLSGEWGWHRKNTLEHRLRKLVCGGSLRLEQAQQEIATDWISAYRKYVGEPR